MNLAGKLKCKIWLLIDQLFKMHNTKSSKSLKAETSFSFLNS